MGREIMSRLTRPKIFARNSVETTVNNWLGAKPPAGIFQSPQLGSSKPGNSVALTRLFLLVHGGVEDEREMVKGLQVLRDRDLWERRLKGCAVLRAKSIRERATWVV